MNSQMNLEIAEQRIADLQRSAAAARRASELEPASEHAPAQVIALRLAGPDEADELAQLALLDSQRPLRGDTLVALIDGRLVAAISLADGRMIADPLVATADARALLRTRAAHLTRPARPRARRFRLRFA